MIGVLINFATVLVGGALGCLLRGAIPEKYSRTVNQGLALCVMVIGVSGAIKTQNSLLLIVSLVVGGALGTLLRLEERLSSLGVWAQARFSKANSRFAEGFVSATLLFCVGAMAVVGSLEAGLKNSPDTLIAKAAIDGVSALILASTMGPGVILSALPLTLYQGALALGAGLVAPFLTDEVIRELSAVGSALIIGISLNMLGVIKGGVRVGDMLPSMLVPLVYIPLSHLF